MKYLKAEDRVGILKTNKKGTEMKIIKVLPDDRIIVQFQDEFKFEKEIHYNNFKRGTVKNPYDKTICGVGYLGEGSFIAHDENGINTKPYDTWTNMIERCYSNNMRHKHFAYEDCTMCDEWLNFQTFAKWYEANFYDIGTERMHIDKDILMKDNKIYAPEKCIFVPQRINMIFMKKNRKIDSDLPNGIHRCIGGFRSEYNTKYLGTYKTLEEALYYYNIEKQLHINEVADEYKNIIPPKLYKALLNWNIKLAA